MAWLRPGPPLGDRLSTEERAVTSVGMNEDDWPSIAHVHSDVRAWLVPEEDIHIKIVTSEGDPVELPPSEVRDLVAELIRLVELAERDNTGG